MKAQIISPRRGRHTYKPRQFIISAGAEAQTSPEKAQKLIGKQVIWKSPAGKIIKGKIQAVHGNKGLLRALFEKGLPGQAVNSSVEISE